MKKLRSSLVMALLFIIGVTAFAQESQSSGTEKVIGYVSGEVDAGEVYELYKSSADSFRGYLAGWQNVGLKDRRTSYSDNQLYDKCLEAARKQYGKYYPDLYIKETSFGVEDRYLEDEEYYSQQVGSSTKYRKRDRKQRVYTYSATVVVKQ